VAWRKGSLADGADSVAQQVAPQSHWPHLKALILVVSSVQSAERSHPSGKQCPIS